MPEVLLQNSGKTLTFNQIAACTGFLMFHMTSGNEINVMQELGNVTTRGVVVIRCLSGYRQIDGLPFYHLFLPIHCLPDLLS